MVAAVSARFRETQVWQRSKYDAEIGSGGGGGGCGRAYSGSHFSGMLLLIKWATEAKCLSVSSQTLPVKLRMSFEYSASYRHELADASVDVEMTYYVKKVLVVLRHYGVYPVSGAVLRPPESECRR